MQNLNSKSNFIADEEGSATILGLFFFLSSAVILGLALDQANGFRVQTQMQIATDAGALAGAAHLNDEEHARSLAVEVANMNLPENGQITGEDILFGHIDPDTFSFVAGESEEGGFTALSVDASRTTAAENAVPTYLLKLVGFDTLNVVTDSVAAAQSNFGGGGYAGCEDAVFYSESSVSAGGGYDFEGAVCVHGNGSDLSGGTYVHSGGNETFSKEVRYSAPDIDAIYLGSSYSPAELDLDEIIVERSMEPSLLPILDSMYDELWTALWDDEAETTQNALLPDFLFDDGAAQVVRIDGDWTGYTTDPGSWYTLPLLEPGNIYVVDGNVQIPYNSDISDVAIITSGTVNVGGGGNTQFDNFFLLAQGSVISSQAATWGPSGDVCQSGVYSVYLFSLDRLSFGTVTGGQASGVVAAAPSMSIGGAMTASGVYFETSNHFDLGGAMDISACGDARQPDYTLTDFSIESFGSYLFN
jgi:hypothetical protein